MRWKIKEVTITNDQGTSCFVKVKVVFDSKTLHKKNIKVVSSESVFNNSYSL